MNLNKQKYLWCPVCKQTFIQDKFNGKYIGWFTSPDDPNSRPACVKCFIKGIKTLLIFPPYIVTYPAYEKLSEEAKEQHMDWIHASRIKHKTTHLCVECKHSLQILYQTQTGITYNKDLECQHEIYKHRITDFVYGNTTITYPMCRDINKNGLCSWWEQK